MAANSAISWTDHTFNPWIGCTRVSPACDGCYADALMGMNGRMKRAQWGGPGIGVGTRVRTAPTNWRQPLAWDRQAEAAGTRPFVFCASLADVFDNAVPKEWRRDLFSLIRATPNLVWLLLTKRPANIARLYHEIAAVDEDPRQSWHWPSNAAIGCTVVTQEEADRDTPELLYAKQLLRPAFAFLSLEPLLGPIDLLPYLFIATHEDDRRLAATDEEVELPYHDPATTPVDEISTPRVDWVITGGETDQGGHKARPSHPRWYLDIRDQCEAAQVAYNHKQHGEWAPVRWMDEALIEAVYHPAPERHPEARRRCKVEVTVLHEDGSQHDPGAAGAFDCGSGAMTMFKVNRHRAGRQVDGAIHDARPQVRP